VQHLSGEVKLGFSAFNFLHSLVSNYFLGSFLTFCSLLLFYFFCFCSNVFYMQDEFEEADELGKLDCGHGFHIQCIKKWLAQKNKCPVCKTEPVARA
jgi:hypothetical protein